MSLALTAFLICFVLIFILRLPIALGMLMTTGVYLLISGQDPGLVAVCSFPAVV